MCRPPGRHAWGLHGGGRRGSHVARLGWCIHLVDALMAPLGLIERSRLITPGGVFFLNELPRGLGFSILFVAFNAFVA